MRKLFRSLHRCIAPGFLAGLAACGGTPPQEVNARADAPDNYYIGSQAIHAHLDQGPGGSWMLTTVTESDRPPDGGFLVRLNDLAPAFDTRVAVCEPQAYPPNHKCNPLHPFREKDIGVMDRIISGSIAAGTGGKVTGVSRTYETAFNEAAFNQAVDEALTNTGLGSERRAFLLSLERYDALLASGRANLEAGRQRALSRHEDTNKVALEFQPHITGLSRYYTSDIDFRDLVRLEAQAPQLPESAALEAPGILPCDARHCVHKARAAIEELSVRLERETARLDGILADGASEYTLQCDARSHAGYSFVLECPETLTASGGDPVTVPLALNILSRDFDALYPEFEIGDDKLSVEIDGESIRFINRTNSYIIISAKTIYYNSQAETHSQRIDVAPGVAVERPIDEFVTPAIRIEASYRQMTPDKADGTTFRFGFATSYQLAGSAEKNTLYDLREFNAGCVIENRIRPGSCRQPTAAAAPEEGGRGIDSYRADEPRNPPMPR